MSNQKFDLIFVIVMCVLAVGSLIAILTTILYKRLKKGLKHKKTIAGGEDYEAAFNDIMTDVFWKKLLDFVETHDVNELKDYLKVYYILDNLYDAMCETGFDEYFINGRSANGRHNKEYLLGCCRLFDCDTDFTDLCKDALALDQKFNLEKNGENLPPECLTSLADLNQRFIALDEKVHLQYQLKKYFVIGYRHTAQKHTLTDEFDASIYDRPNANDYDNYIDWQA